jgi:hypothetical protein
MADDPGRRLIPVVAAVIVSAGRAVVHPLDFTTTLA